MSPWRASRPKATIVGHVGRSELPRLLDPRLRRPLRRSRRGRRYRRDPAAADARRVLGGAHLQREDGALAAHRRHDLRRRARRCTKKRSSTRASGAFVNRDLAGYLVPVHADIPDIDAVMLDELRRQGQRARREGRRRARHTAARTRRWRTRCSTRPACGCATSRSRSRSCCPVCRCSTRDGRRVKASYSGLIPAALITLA